MKPERDKHISKTLALVLRHQPETLNLTLDAQGWAPVQAVLQGFAQKHNAVTREELDYVVTHNGKQRYEFSPDGTQIRARQGHSVEVKLGYQPQTPPSVLYHGTVAKALESIRMQGLSKMNRHHVHLSADRETAQIVGNRRGKAVILEIDAAQMAQAGSEFFVTENGVWLTDSVPVAYIRFPDSA